MPIQQDLHELHNRLLAELARLAPQLEAVALDLHAHPETAWQEHRSAGVLTGLLEASGLPVERAFCGLETAFRSRVELGPGGPTVTLVAEYDALPGLGHACGHNLIGTASVGALIALARVLPGVAGRVQVIGTPAEEGGGGKVHLLERGAFADTDLAMMVHPGSRTMVNRLSLAATLLTFTYHGKATHAATAPHLGVNALEACIQTFNAVNALRSTFRDETRVLGVITNGGAGGAYPVLAQAQFRLRHRSQAYLQEVKEKVIQAAQGAALSVGARLEVAEDPYAFRAERKVNGPLAQRFRHHLEALGEPVQQPPLMGGMGSSDFNNLSQLVPAIHPYIAIAPEGTATHTPAFAEAAASPAGLRGLHLGAQALALTAADVLLDPNLWSQIQQDFSGGSV